MKPTGGNDDRMHILLLSEREVHVLGALYALGLMAGLSPKLRDSARTKEFEETRDMTAAMLSMEPFLTVANGVRDKILDLATEDAER